MKYSAPHIVLISLSFIILCGTIFGFYNIAKRVWLLTALEKKEGIVVSCKSEYFKRGKRRGGTGPRVQKYTPVVEVETGIKITGLLFSSREACSELIRKPVAVLIDSSEENGGYILTFLQYWAAPLALIIGIILANILIVYPTAIVIMRQ